MEQMKQVLSASLVWRWLTAVCLWFSRQWERSGLVQWFLHPAGWNRASSERSVFFKLWSLVRRGLCWLYDKLRLEKLFAGSIFTRTWLWCAIPVVLAPMLAVSRPSLITMGLAAIGYASLASVKDTVKALTVGGVAPSEATVKDGSYVVQRPFVLVTKDGTKLSDSAQKFFDYITSDAASQIISKAGAVPVK